MTRGKTIAVLCAMRSYVAETATQEQALENAIQALERLTDDDFPEWKEENERK